jgi:hypothetical protein
VAPTAEARLLTEDDLPVKLLARWGAQVDDVDQMRIGGPDSVTRAHGGMVTRRP